MGSSIATNIYCPECGPAVNEPISSLSPDLALLFLMWHFLSSHPGTPALELLDKVEPPAKEPS